MSTATDIDTFATIFAQATGIDPKASGENWATDVYNVAKKYINQGITSENTVLYDLVLADKEAPESYKKRFSAITELKKQNANLQLSVAEYVKQEKQYKNLLTQSGLSSLANSEDIKKFFVNGISYDVAAERINGAFSAIDNADEYTKSILNERFPGLTKADIAQGLLTGAEGTAEIEKKVKGAQMLGAAKAAGIKTALTEEQLLASNLTPGDAKTAFATIAAQQEGVQQAARIFGDTTSRQGLQAELEKKELGIAPSQKVEGLASQARAQFAGGTGITTGSLSKRKPGQL